MPLRFLDDSNYTLGMIRDTPSWLLPKGAVYDAKDVIFDQTGIVRQRGGSQFLNVVSSTAFCTSIGFVRSDDATAIEELYGLDGKTGNLFLVNKSTGATTALGTPAPVGIVGRPARHFGFLVFPINATAQVTHGALSVAGETVNTSFTNGVASALVAGTPSITLTGADVTTNVKVGAVVRAAFTGPDGPYVYWGRVISIDTTKIFTVWPTPTVGGAIAIGALTTGPSRASGAGGVCAASFQNRLLLGNTMDLSASAALRNDRRIIYSTLPTEYAAGSGNIGSTFVDSGSWPRLNYVDVPGADPIIAMEPVSGNQLLIFTATRPYLLSGNLTTQAATTNPTVTFDLSEVQGNATCISDLGVQHTNNGVIWAGYGGIYAWNGRDPVDLTDKKINAYWRGLTSGANFAVHGSAYVNNHYVVAGTSAGTAFQLAINLSTLAWARWTNIDIFIGTPRPTNPAQVYAARWWDQSGTAPSGLNDPQVFRMETIFGPFTLNTGTVPSYGQDDNGTNVSHSITTRVLGGDVETQKIQQRCTIRYQMSASGANTSVTAQTKTDARDITPEGVRALGSLSNTDSRVVTNATNANPIVITTSANFAGQDGDFVDINGVGGNLNANGRWRILKLTNTTFSLIGSSGSAAYTSGGSMKRLTEQDFLTSVLDPGQGVSFTIANSGTTNGFELHGIRVAFFEKKPVMSS